MRVGYATGAALLGAGLYRGAARRDRAAVLADPGRAELERALFPDVTRLRPWTGADLVVDAYGPEGAPIVVLVHGWTCTARFWTRQIQGLREDHRVVAYDARGHGRSAPAEDGDYSIEALADDLEAVLAACVPEGERFVLAGHSMGAMTIVAWAARHPQTVERLAAAALINTGIGELVGESRVAPLPSRLAAVQAALGPLVLSAPGRAPTKTGPLTHRAMRYVALSAAATPAEVAFCEQMALDCHAPARAGCGRTLAGLDLWEALPALDAPTVVVASERDRLTPVAHGERIAGKLACPAGPVVVLPGAGHMGPVEAGPAVNEVLRGLVAGHLVPAAGAAVAV